MSWDSSYRKEAIKMLKAKAQSDRSQAIASLQIMLDHPAGIGDHSTNDLYNNLNEALSALADADDRLETLSRYELFNYG
tara:strand:+ start:265 stop:501 length:237 start_codon:yes stop_codon:yes gene_type:complete